MVCATGYSDLVRPPASYTTALKRRQLASGYPGTAGLAPFCVEEDQVVMSALGGDPRSTANLCPEPRHITAAAGGDAGADAKDSYESWLDSRVCHDHAIQLADAQRAQATNWSPAWTAAAGRPRGVTNTG